MSKKDDKKKGKGKADHNGGKLGSKEYEAALYDLQVELCKVQEWVKETKARICVVFEGRDAAGKGGVIKRITERVSPRVFHVEALPAPTEREKTQFYYQRYMARLPAGGEVALFDRSWYNRAGVERVMGFCNELEYQQFLRTCPGFERALVEDGMLLIKYWFEVSMEEQEKRFQARIEDQTKQWKLSPMDLESMSRWYDYSRAKDMMFATTDTEWAPWYVVKADNKKKARLNCITHLLSQIPYEEIKRDKVKLPKRRIDESYVEPNRVYNYVPDAY
jgi:polyphosphate kinase 2